MIIVPQTPGATGKERRQTLSVSLIPFGVNQKNGAAATWNPSMAECMQPTEPAGINSCGSDLRLIYSGPSASLPSSSTFWRQILLRAADPRTAIFPPAAVPLRARLAILSTAADSLRLTALQRNGKHTEIQNTRVSINCHHDLPLLPIEFYSIILSYPHRS
jgi:hypothetical protein